MPLADSRYCFRLPDGFSDIELAPWLCAGLIGYRALRKAGDAKRVSESTALAPPPTSSRSLRDFEGRRTVRLHPPRRHRARRIFAREPGAAWAGGKLTSAPPEELDAAILLAPVGALVPTALRDVAKGRSGGMRRHPHERHPPVSYEILWGERRICSVANLTRRDGRNSSSLRNGCPCDDGVAVSAGSRERGAEGAASKARSPAPRC